MESELTPEQKSDRSSRFTLGPTLEYGIDAVHSISSDEIDRIARGEAALWVWGAVEYVDAFKEARALNFRLWTQQIQPGVRGLHLHNEGNEAT